eukprot:s664_g16.t1
MRLAASQLKDVAICRFILDSGNFWDISKDQQRPLNRSLPLKEKSRSWRFAMLNSEGAPAPYDKICITATKGIGLSNLCEGDHPCLMKLLGR